MKSGICVCCVSLCMGVCMRVRVSTSVGYQSPERQYRYHPALLRAIVTFIIYVHVCVHMHVDKVTQSNAICNQSSAPGSPPPQHPGGAQT